MDSITTLIVEDEPMLAEILVDTIKIFPQFSIVGIADKLESAKKQIRLYQPQLILLDNFLPDGKGIDLIRHTISTNYTGRIIFITADNHMDTISDALRMGVFDYLIKPVHYQRLQHTLERFTRYRSSLRSSEQANQTHVDALFNMGILWCVSTAAPVCSYGIKKAGWYAWRAIRWKWRSGCRPVMTQE